MSLVTAREVQNRSDHTPAPSLPSHASFALDGGQPREALLEIILTAELEFVKF